MRQKTGRTDDAIKYYIKALNDEGTKFQLATVHNNLGMVYSSCGNYSEAWKHHCEAVILADEHHLHYSEFNRNCLRAEKRFSQWSNNQTSNLNEMIPEKK